MCAQETDSTWFQLNFILKSFYLKQLPCHLVTWKLQLIKCNFQSPGFEGKLLDLAEAAHILLSTDLFSLDGFIRDAVVIFSTGFQPCYQSYLSELYHCLKGFWLRRPWKYAWPQKAVQMRQSLKNCPYQTCDQYSEHTLCPDMLR